MLFIVIQNHNKYEVLINLPSMSIIPSAWFFKFWELNCCLILVIFRLFCAEFEDYSFNFENVGINLLFLSL